MLTSLPVWAIIVTHGCSVFGYFTVVNQLPTFTKYILHYNIKANGLLSSLPYLGKYLFAVMTSYLADYLRQSNKLTTTATRKIFTSFGWISHISQQYNMELSILLDLNLLSSCHHSWTANGRPSVLWVWQGGVNCHFHFGIDHQWCSNSRLPQQWLGHSAKFFGNNFRTCKYSFLSWRFFVHFDGGHSDTRQRKYFIVGRLVWLLAVLIVHLKQLSYFFIHFPFL